MLKVYAYKGCSTCRNATKWLTANKIAFQEIPIRETPPSLEELKDAFAARGGDVRKFFNTSGQDYRNLRLSEMLAAISDEEALGLLTKNGNLIKRPFVVSEKAYLVGFKEDEWAKALL